MKKCPIVPIDISKNREILDCDFLEFPWKRDPNGYFLVKIEGEIICCGFVDNNHKMILELRGKDPSKIIREIARRKLCGVEHMGYIASELMIALNCIKNSKEYIQR